MQDDAGRRLHRQAVPRSIFSTKGLDDISMKQMAEALKNPQPDQTFLTNVDVGVAMDSPATRGQFGPEFDLMTDRINVAYGAILAVMLSAEKKFAYNSARVGQDISDIIVWDLQQNYKAGIDLQLLWPVAEQAGFDTNLLRPGLEYNIPDEVEEYTAADALNACVAGKITDDEYREIMRQQAHWPLEEIPMSVLQPTLPMPGQLPMNTQPVNPRMPMTQPAATPGHMSTNVPMPPQFAAGEEAAVYPKQFWDDQMYQITVGDKTYDLTKMNDQEFRRYLLWRTGVAGSKLKGSPDPVAPS